MRLNLFGFLMPKEEAFIDLFCDQSKMVIAAAEQLCAMIKEDAPTEERFARIDRLEREADEVAKRVFIAGNHTFNAPIDRENILSLAHELDDIVDLVEEAAKEIKRYGVRRFSEEMKAMAEAILLCAEAIQDAIPLLGSITRDHRKLLDLCERVGRIEGEADERFDAGLTRLRALLQASEMDVIGYIDLKEIYERLEDVVDKCDDVANELRTITAKHV